MLLEDVAMRAGNRDEAKSAYRLRNLLVRPKPRRNLVLRRPMRSRLLEGVKQSANS